MLNIVRHGLVPITCRGYILLIQAMDLTLGRTGKDGTLQAQWERATWPKLKELTEKSPDAGIHFLRMFLPML